MSLYGVMSTSISGMAAQANRLSAVADNVANSGTIGYKRANVQFSAQPLSTAVSSYQSGGVMANYKFDVSQQGGFRNSSSGTDLAISGQGFFVVQDISGQFLLTRAGSFFVSDDGSLMNLSGQRLMAYPADAGASATSMGSLVPVIQSPHLAALPTSRFQLVTNLPTGDDVVAAANLPSGNSATADFSGKTSVVAYDSQGSERTLDVYFAKTADSEWEVSVYDAADSTNGSFPYGSAALATETLTFGVDGQLEATSATGVDISLDAGLTTRLDFTDTSQFGLDYSVLVATGDGAPPGVLTNLEVGADGTVTGIYDSDARRTLFQLAIARVPSPDNLKPLDGTTFQVTNKSGDVVLSRPTEAGSGSIVSGALEESNADLATELTLMIEAQRAYTANSKVFQTGADLVDVLLSLKR